MKPLTKPKLLMISHCLPDPCGQAADARAWQLLRLSGMDHEVDLACIVQDRVNLAQWRLAAAQTSRLAIDTLSLGGRCISRLRQLMHPRMGHGMQLPHAMGPSISAWQESTAYDAVLCTHPALWKLARQITAGQTICDLDGAGDPASHQAVWDECDLLTISQRDRLPWSHLFSSQADRLLHLPHAVDLDCFDPQDALEHQPRLMLHVDQRTRMGKAVSHWFARHVWSHVKQAVPAAQWSPLTGQTRAMQQAMREASVIVSPVEDPNLGQWPVLQSMAMCRPVIAAGKAISQMDVRHGEHLFVSNKTQDWVEHCVESLRSATLRMKLARAGRSYVEHHCPIQRSGQVMTQWLSQRSPAALAATNPPYLALAA